MSLIRASLSKRIDQALGRSCADVAIKDTRILILATGALEQGDVAITCEMIMTPMTAIPSM